MRREKLQKSNPLFCLMIQQQFSTGYQKQMFQTHRKTVSDKARSCTHLSILSNFNILPYFYFYLV